MAVRRQWGPGGVRDAVVARQLVEGELAIDLERFFFSSRRRHTRYIGDWSSDVCSSDLSPARLPRPSLARSARGVPQEMRAVRGVRCARAARDRRNRRALAAARAQRRAAGVRRPRARGAEGAATRGTHARIRTALPLAWTRVAAPVPAPGPDAPPPDAARREPRS